MSRYDHLRAQDEGPFESVAMPNTMRSLFKLGMKAVLTDDRRRAVFEGYGLRLEIPSDADLGTVECLRLIVEKARVDGAKEQQALMRKVLGIGS